MTASRLAMRELPVENQLSSVRLRISPTSQPQPFLCFPPFTSGPLRLPNAYPWASTFTFTHLILSATIPTITLTTSRPTFSYLKF